MKVEGRVVGCVCVFVCVCLCRNCLKKQEKKPLRAGWLDPLTGQGWDLQLLFREDSLCNRDPKYVPLMIIPKAR